jgi:hypothetical protein
MEPNMTTKDDFCIEHYSAILFQQLDDASSSWNLKSRQQPMDINVGSLGNAYTAACMTFLDDKKPWRDVMDKQLEIVFRGLGSNSYPHPGMLGGLVGLSLLLQKMKRDENDYLSALAKLEHRIILHYRKTLNELRQSVGLPRFSYDYGIGITGAVYYFALHPPQSVEAQKFYNDAVDFLVSVGLSDFMDFFWTASIDVPDDIVQQDPKAGFGILDLGYAHGIIGVLGTLFSVRIRNRTEEVDSVISNIIEAIRRACDATMLPGVPYYLCRLPITQISFDIDDDFSPGPISRNGWCYGVAIIDLLQHKYNMELPQSIRSCFNADINLKADRGEFDGPGLCHGVGGRIVMQRMMKKAIPDSWLALARRLMFEDIVDNGNQDSFLKNPGFWDGVGGLHIAMLYAESKRPFPSPLELLGVPDDINLL